MFKIVLPPLILFIVGALMFSGCYIANGNDICAILALTSAIGTLLSVVFLLFVDK